MKPYQSIYPLLTAILVIAASCKKETAEQQTTVEATTIIDVAYGPGPLQTMDVYLPQNRTPNTPVIIILHGGAFVTGDKNQFSVQSQSLANEGYAVLNVNYRLVDSLGLLQTPPLRKESAVNIAGQLTDIGNAVGFASGKAAEWAMSSSGWCISGHSAGGTLALLYAYGATNADKRITVAANWAGITDLSYQDEVQIQFLDPRLTELFRRAVGARPDNQNRPAFLAVSPYWVANSGAAVPTINIRPEFNDALGLIDTSQPSYQAFTNVLDAKNVPNKWVEVAGADHNFTKPGNWELALSETIAFFEQYRKQ